MTIFNRRYKFEEIRYHNDMIPKAYMIYYDGKLLPSSIITKVEDAITICDWLNSINEDEDEFDG